MTDTPPDPAGLDLQDLATLLHLINIGISRGAWDRSELRAVIDVADKLELFLKAQSALVGAAEK